MAYVRGNRGDYDRWAASGLSDWSYAKLLPYFRRQESWEGGASLYRGGDGPLTTQFCRYRTRCSTPSPKPDATAGHALDRRLQWRPAGRLRPPADDDPQRPPRQRRHGLSAPRAAAARTCRSPSKRSSPASSSSAAAPSAVEYRARGKTERVNAPARGHPRRRRRSTRRSF